ncbi:MAG TPA: glycerol-3-phosphate acyltransferase [Acidimicrobiia bacterium]|nr:glycerol-3-phosphate acyltransferase [Acidimicrobiia bacterium]
MTHPVLWLTPIIAYLLGAVPFAFLIGRALGVDLRKVGSGNVGAGNLTRVAGLKAGFAAAILDGFKALIPVVLMREQLLGPALVAVSGLAIVIGHNWSIFMRGRSGRGLAPSAGVLLGIDPSLIVWPGGWAVAGWKFGGGLCGFLGWASLPVLAVIFHRPAASVLGCLGLSLLMVGRRMQGNPGRLPGLRASLHRAVFDTDGQHLSRATEPVRF